MADFFERAYNFAVNGGKFGSREVNYAPSNNYNVNVAFSQKIVGAQPDTISQRETREQTFEPYSLRPLICSLGLRVTVCAVVIAGAITVLKGDNLTVAPANGDSETHSDSNLLACVPHSANSASVLPSGTILPSSISVSDPVPSLPVFPLTPTASPATSLPAPLEIFGREELIQDTVNTILQNSDIRKHICFRGGPGMGKTTIAIGIIHNQRIIQHFANARHWVHGQKAINIPDDKKAEKLLEYIAESFRLDLTAQGSPQANIKYFLENNDAPRIIVLDNFETMWDPPAAQKEVENILQFLAHFPQLTIILTTRNAHNPVTEPNRVSWHTLKSIEALSPDASRTLFTSLSLIESIDTRLDDLLHAVDYVPLAIVLMASYGQENYTTSQILDIWHQRLSKSNSTQTAYKDDKDPLIKLDNSIAMSLEGPLLKLNPNAHVLLRIIANLPDGIKRDNLQEIVPLISDADRVAAVLIRVSLLMNSGESLRMHSTIRSFMLRNYDLDASHEQNMRNFYFHLIHDAGGNPGAPEFLERAWRLSQEETNAQAILVSSLKHNFSNWAPISMDYANYLIWNTPSIEATKMVVRLISDITSGTSHKAIQEATHRISCPVTQGMGMQYQIAELLFPMALLRLGTMYFRLDKYSDATKALYEAIDRSEKLDQLNVAAEARYILGEVARLRHNHSAALQLYSEAYTQYEEEGNLSGMSACLRGKGIVYFQERRNLSDVVDMINMAQSKCSTDAQTCIADCERELGRVYRETNHAESIRLLGKTRSYYLIHGPPRHAGIALYQMAIVYYQIGHYDMAEAAFNEAFEEFRLVRNDAQMGYCIFHLAEMNFQRGSLQESLELYLRAASMFKHMENNYMVGLSLRGQGDVYRRLCQLEDAMKAYRSAHILGNVYAKEDIRNINDMPCAFRLVWENITFRFLIFALAIGCVVLCLISLYKRVAR